MAHLICEICGKDFGFSHAFDPGPDRSDAHSSLYKHCICEHGSTHDEAYDISGNAVWDD